MRALIVEDDPVSAKMIDAALKSEGIIGELAEMGKDAIDLAKHRAFDIVVLDLHLPDMDGFEVVRRLRSAKVRTPVLFLAEVNEIDDKVRGLTTGADDYLTKPFHKGELIARIHAIVRRSKGHSESVIKTGKLTVNLDTRSVDVEGRRLHVTGKEYSILELLSLRKGTTLTKEMILDHLYDGINEPEPEMIDVFICKIRKKIAMATGGSHYIETVWGRGYVLKNPKANSGIFSFDRSAYSADVQYIGRLLSRGLLLIEESKTLLDFLPNELFSREDVAALDTTESVFRILSERTEAPDYAEADLILIDVGVQQILTLTDHVVREVSIVPQELQRALSATGTHGATTVAKPHVKITGLADDQLEFHNESFLMMRDFSRCVNHAMSVSEKILCNVALIIELLSRLIRIFAQLVPFAGRH